MNANLQAKVSAAIFTASSMIVYLATLPPEQQDAVTGPLVALIPLNWRPEIGLGLKAIAAISGFWGLFQAAESVPKPSQTTPPPAAMPPKA